jgi:hypothetical protein
MISVVTTDKMQIEFRIDLSREIAGDLNSEIDPDIPLKKYLVEKKSRSFGARSTSTAARARRPPF